MGRVTLRRGSGARLALLALIWGSSFVWIKVGLRGFAPMQLVFLRLLLAAGVLLLICRIRGLRMPREPVVWVHFAVATTVGNVITDDGPTVASTVTYLIPVVAVLFGAGGVAEPAGARRHDRGTRRRRAGPAHRRPPDPAAAPTKPVRAAGLGKRGAQRPGTAGGRPGQW